MADSIGGFLKRLRLRRGWGLREFSMRSGVDDAMLSRWESAEYQPQLEPLNQALDCLNVSVEERRQALSLLKGPRALTAMRALSRPALDDGTALIEWENYLPHTGDLWRALRERNEIKQSEVAAEIGCNIATVSRWEKGAAPPPHQKLPRLFELFHASAKDRAMLQDGLVTLPLPRRQVSLDRCEWFLAALVKRIDSGIPIDDGRFFALESLLWQHVHRRESALALLVEAYTWHGEWLVRWGRGKEMQRYAEQSLALTDYLCARLARPGAWARAVYLMARCDAEKHRADAFQRTHTWLAQATLPIDESNLCREAASYASSTRNFHVAESIILRGRTALERIGDPDGLHLNRYVHAQILLRAGDASRALDLLPARRDSCPYQSIQDDLLRTDILLTLQQKAEASASLVRCKQTVEEYGLLHHQSEIKKYEQQL
jgi:transcriptional regulator with XRE-family HTH domain